MERLAELDLRDRRGDEPGVGAQLLELAAGLDRRPGQPLFAAVTWTA